MMIGSPQIEKAAVLPGELEVLTRLVSDLANQDERKRYADWLSQNGDRPRSEFVLDLSRCVEDLGNCQLPDQGEFSGAWTNLMGFKLCEGIQKFGLEEYLPALLSVAKPMLVLTTESVCVTKLGGRGFDPPESETMPIGATKFLGNPDLPESQDWPICSSGRMGFWAQFNLGELANTVACQPLPSDGLLSLFIFRGDYPEDRLQIIYSKDLSTLTRKERPADLDEDRNDIRAPYKLRICENLDLPRSDNGLRLEDDPTREHLAPFDANDDLGEQLGNLRNELHACQDHLMGYPIQSTMGSDMRPGLDWEHLICFGGYSNPVWDWGDGDHLAIFAKHDELSSGNLQTLFENEG